MKVKVLDSICGSGKSYYARHTIINKGTGKYIFVTPFLAEITKTLEECPNFHEPKDYGRGKLYSLHRLLEEGKNVATTHALFHLVTEETKDLLDGYTLILDEVMDVVEQVPIIKEDLDIILDKLVYINEDGMLIWKGGDDYPGKFSDIKTYCQNKGVFIVNDTALMWTFPVSLFDVFKETYILTFMFQCQMQAYYYKLNNLEYEHLMVTVNDDGTRSVVPYKEAKYKMKGNINIYEGVLNDIGEKNTALSKQWYKNYVSTKVRVLKNNAYNYFRHHANVKTKEVIWTTFKDFKDIVKINGYAKSFLSSNARATNEYANRTSMAYTINKFMNPIFVHFFQEKGIDVNQDDYATSELIQWIFRSAIRNGEDVNIYIPSSRMRNLLKNFLENCE